MAKSVLRKTLWNVKSATIGGSWELSALGGLLNGVIYINEEVFEGRKPKGLFLLSDTGREKSVNDLDLSTIGAVALKYEGTANGLVAYSVTGPTVTPASEGLYQIDGQFTMDDGSSGDGSYTKDEVDNLLTDKVDVGAAPKVSKGSAGSTSPATALPADADLAATVAKVNEVIKLLNTVRSTAGAGLTTANGVIDSLTLSKLMPL